MDVTKLPPLPATPGAAPSGGTPPESGAARGAGPVTNPDTMTSGTAPGISAPGTSAPGTSAPGTSGLGTWVPGAAPGALAPTQFLDQLHIQPLDMAGALQILIAEVRAELALSGELPRPDAAMADAAPPSPGQLPAPASPGPVSPGPASPGPVSPGVALLGAAAPQSLLQLFLHALPEPGSRPPADWLAATSRVETALQDALDKAVDAVARWRNVPAAVVDAANETRATVLAALADEPVNPLWLRPEWLGLAPRMERYHRRRRAARRGLSDPDWHRPPPDADSADMDPAEAAAAPRGKG